MKGSEEQSTNSERPRRLDLLNALQYIIGKCGTEDIRCSAAEKHTTIRSYTVSTPKRQRKIKDRARKKETDRQ